MIISHVIWKFRKEPGLVVTVVGEGYDLGAEKFLWLDWRNILLISLFLHGKMVQYKGACNYKAEKNVKIFLSTAIAFKNEKDINEFFWFVNRYF